MAVEIAELQAILSCEIVLAEAGRRQKWREY